MKTPTINALKLLCLSALLACAFGAHAASFDCAKAKSDVERMVCGDAQTSALDSKLQQTYTEALAATDTYGRKELAREQRNWIRYTRGICHEVACLKQAYSDRIAVLARNERYIINDAPDDCIKPSAVGNSNGNDCLNLVIYRDPNVRIDSFNNSLIQYGLNGRIIGCTKLIGEPAGTAQGNHSFGGYCVLQRDGQRRGVEICNDDMVGDFKMQPINQHDHTDKRLIDFVYDNCSGN